MPLGITKFDDQWRASCDQQSSRKRTIKRFQARSSIHPRERRIRSPAGQRAIWRFKGIETGYLAHRYWSSACPGCPIKQQCTTSPYRRIARVEHEAVLEAMQARLEQMPETARIRRQTADHVSGLQSETHHADVWRRAADADHQGVAAPNPLTTGLVAVAGIAPTGLAAV